MSEMSRPEVDGLNTGYAALLLEQYLDNPSAVPSEWRALFESAPEALLATQVLSDFVPPEAQKAVKKGKWLAGVSGSPGKAPRINPRNEFEFETVADAAKTIALGFPAAKKAALDAGTAPDQKDAGSAIH